MSEDAEQFGPDERRFAVTATWIVIASALLTLLLGAVTFVPRDGNECAEAAPWWHFDWLYRIVLLFDLGEANESAPDCALPGFAMVGRFTGVFTVAAAGLSVVASVLAGPFRRARLARMRGHTLVIGCSEVGLGHAAHARGKRRKVVLVDAAPTAQARAAAQLHGFLLHAADLSRRPSFDGLRLQHVTRCVVATDDDTANLAHSVELARRLTAMEALRRVRPGQPRRVPVEVRLEDPVIARAAMQDGLDLRIDPFSVAENLARRFCEQARLQEIADLAGQARVHVLMAGFGRFGPALAAQIAQTSLTREGGGPRISVLSAQPQRVRQAMALAYPHYQQALDLVPIAADPADLPIDGAIDLAAIAQACPVTAVLVLGDDAAQQDCFAQGLAVRAALQRADRLRAPVYALAEDAEPVQRLTRPAAACPRPSQVFETISLAAARTIPLDWPARDAQARQFHDAYRQTRREAGDTSTNKAALEPWETLGHSLRQANRQVVDHIPAKLLAAGCMVPAGPPRAPDGFDRLADPAVREELARLEHARWTAERGLSGFRPGAVRDNARFVHDLMVPYDALPTLPRQPGTGVWQDLDRQQIDVLARLIKPSRDRRAADAPHRAKVRVDVWIGLAASPGLTGHALDLAIGQLRARFGAVMAAQTEAAFTFLVPNAQGPVGLLLTNLRRLCAEQQRQHRWVVVEGVRTDPFAPPADPPGMATCPSLPGRIVELAAHDHEPPQTGPERQRAYLALRPHVLIAVALADAGADDPARAIAAWRRDPARIPQPLRAFAARPGAVAADSLIEIEVGP